MSSDQIQPEREYYSRRQTSQAKITGRAWVKRDLEFWHRCTVEQYDGTSVTVSLDNMDELTVDYDCVERFELQPGELVFVQDWDGAISGYPAFLIGGKGEVVEVEAPESLFGKVERHTCFLRDIRFYDGLTPTDWQAGTRVFAYKRIPFNPPLFLLFPAIIQEVQFEVCVVVEFGDGESAVVPSTLVEQPALGPGDMVYTCTSFVSHGINPDERWSPCRIVERDGNNLVLQDGTGDRFESETSMIAVLPKGYTMIDGKFEKTQSDPAGDYGRLQPATNYDVHIVRTDDWQAAEDDPITKAQVDGLIAADPELAWSRGGSVGIRDEVSRYSSILWKGQPCFWWNGNEIRCATPNKEQLAKMIDIAVELDANVIGGDGQEYH